MKRIIILGSTGSIGHSAIRAANLMQDVEIAGLHAHTDKDQLRKIAKELSVDNLCLSGAPRQTGFRYSGTQGLTDFIFETDADMVVNGISGAAGLIPSWESIRSGKDLALANKETMVLAGDLVLEEAEKNGVSVIPVDSEHSAVSQLYRRFSGSELDSLILTASGGALRDVPIEKLEQVTPEDALKHPTWKMGKKITIDSASMANKGLEVIEACRFFQVPPGKVQVVIHPQSKIHSMIRTVDGVLYAQMSNPDMSVALQNAYTYPEIRGPRTASFDFSGSHLTFHEVDFDRYPMLKLAYSVAVRDCSSIIYNGSNEIAVAAFLHGKIKFTQIYNITVHTLEMIPSREITCITDVLELDSESRRTADKVIQTMEFAV